MAPGATEHLTGIRRSLDTRGRMGALAVRGHLRQSIVDILTTPQGTRVMLPEYGSKLPRLLDRPVTPSWRLSVYAAVVEALGRWEPRVRVERIRVTAVYAGAMDLEVDYRVFGREEIETLGVKVGHNEETKA